VNRLMYMTVIYLLSLMEHSSFIFCLAAVVLPGLHTCLLSGPFEGLCLHTVCCVLQAAHYIGLNCNVVLCVQHLSDDAVVGNDKVRHALRSYS
jgi:hypothetical protein